MTDATEEQKLVERLNESAALLVKHAGKMRNVWPNDNDYADAASRMTEAAETISRLVRERDEARDTNRDLHRRAQGHESEEAQQLRMVKYQEGNRLSKMWGDMWKAEFDRLLSAHNELQLVYEEAARVLGMPFGKYHSVMDSAYGKRPDQARPREVFANVFINYPNGGVQSFSVVESVRSLAARATASEAKLEEMRKALEPLSTFARWAIRESAFSGMELEGGEVQEEALSRGLIVRTIYDPERHGPSDVADPGDDWFEFSDALGEQPTK